MRGALVGLMFGLGVVMVAATVRRATPGSARSGHGLAERRRELLRKAGRPDSGVGRSLGVQALAAVIGLVVVAAATGSVVLALWAGLGAALVPTAYLRSAARRRAAALQACWPDVVDSLSASVRSGMSIQEAVEQLARTGPPPVREPVQRAVASYESSGRFDDCLAELKAELADPVADRVVEVLRMARTTGGSDVGQVLRTSGELLREELRLRSEVQARQSWNINAARVAVAAPWLVLGMLATSPQVLQAYDSAGGAVLLSIGAVACVIAYWLMIRLGRVRDDRRVMTA